MVAKLAGGLASGVLGFGLNSLFGGGGNVQMPTAPNFQNVFTPGGSFLFGDDGLTFQRGEGVSGLLGLQRDLAFGQSRDLNQLLSEVRPGFSQFREAQLADLENQRSAAVGNLQENLAQRRVSGSSFANDSISNANAEFARQRDEVIAQTTLQEIDAFNRIMTQRFQTLSSTFANELSQANLEAQLGLNFAQGVNSNLANIFATQAQLAMSQAQMGASNAQGLGQFFSPFVTGFGNEFGDFFGGMFGGVGFGTGVSPSDAPGTPF